jgi:hypothetical protein
MWWKPGRLIRRVLDLPETDHGRRLGASARSTRAFNPDTVEKMIEMSTLRSA